MEQIQKNTPDIYDAALYLRLSRGTMRKQIKSMNWLCMIFILILEKPELILREPDLNE